MQYISCVSPIPFDSPIHQNDDTCNKPRVLAFRLIPRGGRAAVECKKKTGKPYVMQYISCFHPFRLMHPLTKMMINAISLVCWFQISKFNFQASSFKFQISISMSKLQLPYSNFNFQIQTSIYMFQDSSLKFKTSACNPQISTFKFQTSGPKLQTSKFKFQTFTFQVRRHSCSQNHIIPDPQIV